MYDFCLQNYLLVADSFLMEVLVGTRLKDRHDNSFCCIEPQIEFSKVKIPLLESAPVKLLISGLEVLEDTYR